jgi:hypothetical protein
MRKCNIYHPSSGVLKLTNDIGYQYDRSMADELGERIKARRFREEIVGRVRELASKGKIHWSDHAFERVDERDINMQVAKRILERGDLKDDRVEPGRRADEWKVKMVDRVKPNRDAGVVVIVIQAKRLLVKTVEWEDL